MEGTSLCSRISISVCMLVSVLEWIVSCCGEKTAYSHKIALNLSMMVSFE